MGTLVTLVHTGEYNRYGQVAGLNGRELSKDIFPDIKDKLEGWE